MDPTRAQTILATLADGVHPISGEVFPPDSPYQHAEVVRALYVAIRSMAGAATRAQNAVERQEPNGWRAPAQEIAGRANPSAPAPTAAKQNAGKPWSAEEERELLSKFDAGAAIADIAKQHARSVAGIEARLEKLGRLKPEQRTTVSRYPNGAPRRTPSTATHS